MQCSMMKILFSIFIFSFGLITINQAQADGYNKLGTYKYKSYGNASGSRYYSARNSSSSYRGNGRNSYYSAYKTARRPNFGSYRVGNGSNKKAISTHFTIIKPSKPRPVGPPKGNYGLSMNRPIASR